MRFFKSLVLAFSMFSAIPMPRVDWNEKNLRYMLCAFPLVGAVIGVAEFCVYACAEKLLVPQNIGLVRLVPLALVLIPVAITGGIHLDGFMDTSDALSSHADREKKLAILKDSHAGAFAVLGCVLYFLCQFSLMQELCRSLFGDAKTTVSFYSQHCVIFSLTFVLSRLLSAFSVATFPIAKDSGLVRTFSDASAKRFTALWCAVWFSLISVAMVYFFCWRGAAVILTMLFVFGGYFLMVRRAFGGITGDTAGWFVQVSELLSLAVLVVTMELV